jgi:hypothetical protein
MDFEKQIKKSKQKQKRKELYNPNYKKVFFN